MSESGALGLPIPARRDKAAESVTRLEFRTFV